MAISSYDASMDPPSPTVGSPIKPLSPEKEPLAPAKKQLSSAQKASLARAREKARQSKLAKSQAKADQQKEFVKYHQAVTKQASPAKDQSDTEMSDSESEPSPSPVKHKKGKKNKRFAKKKRKVETSSDSETSEDDPVDARARTANQAWQSKFTRITWLVSKEKSCINRYFRTYKDNSICNYQRVSTCTSIPSDTLAVILGMFSLTSFKPLSSWLSSISKGNLT